MVHAARGIVINALLAMILLSSLVIANQPSQTVPDTETQLKSSETVPDLSDIIPKSTQLSGKLAKLNTKLNNKFDTASMEKAILNIEASFKLYSSQFTKLKDSEDYRIVKLQQLKRKVEEESSKIEAISQSLKKEILVFGDWRKQWLADRQQWSQWQTSWRQDETSNQLTSSFTKANDTIDTALGLIRPELETLLIAQEKVSTVQERIHRLEAELDDLTTVKRFGSSPASSPPMFSKDFFADFNGNLRSVFSEDFDENLWSFGQYLKRSGWIILAQLVAFATLSSVIYRKRQELIKTERWKFLGMRPFSTSIFLICMIMTLVNEYQPTPILWKLADTVFFGIAFIRLISCLTDVSWKKQFVYGLVIFAITNRLLYVITLSLPVFRMYVVCIAIVGLLACWKWSKDSKRLKENPLFTGLLRLGIAFFGLIIITEFWGKDALAFYLFQSMLLTTETIIVFGIFMYIIKGGLEWLFHTSVMHKAITNKDDINSIIKRTGRFVTITLWGLLLLPLILLIWGTYDNLIEATQGFLTFGFDLGSQRFTVGLFIIAAGIIYGTLLFSWIIQKVFMDILLRKRKIEKGVRLSIERLAHYFILSVGFLVVISTLGFEITKITIMLSALGVGIGFGLQGIVNNFVSGLILLFEQPVRVGDTVEINGQWAEIRKIGLRATRVQTFDQADLIVPNADLISNQVTNWTLSNRRVRLTIKVGVAYGSDVPLVMQTLADCAQISPMILENPEPQILFQNFGESSLDFEMRVWIKDADYRLIVKSQLHQEIDQRFRQANIVIAFPQRDLHLCSVDKSISLPKN